jgi:hypothetical protein
MFKKFDISKKLFALNFVENKAPKYFLTVRVNFDEGKVRFLKRHDQAFVYFMTKILTHLSVNNSDLQEQAISDLWVSVMNSLFKSFFNVSEKAKISFLLRLFTNKGICRFLQTDFPQKNYNEFFSDKELEVSRRERKNTHSKIPLVYWKRFSNYKPRHILLQNLPKGNFFFARWKHKENNIKGFNELITLSDVFFFRQIIVDILLRKDKTSLVSKIKKYNQSLSKFRNSFQEVYSETIKFFDEMESSEGLDTVRDEIISERSLFLGEVNLKERYAAYTGKFHVQIKIIDERLRTKMGEYVFTKRTGSHIHYMAAKKGSKKGQKKK